MIPFDVLDLTLYCLIPFFREVNMEFLHSLQTVTIGIYQVSVRRNQINWVSRDDNHLIGRERVLVIVKRIVCFGHPKAIAITCNVLA